MNQMLVEQLKVPNGYKEKIALLDVFVALCLKIINQQKKVTNIDRTQ